jgi:thioredoxin-related protein
VRIALSAVFGLAGVTKLTDVRGTREAVKNFGVPEPLAPYVSLVLPLVELAIAVGLLFNATSRLSAFAALLVLLLFVIAISVNLARGRTHDCHCFGQIYSRPLGWPTLLRNIVFAAAATFVWWQSRSNPAPGVFETLAKLDASQWLLLLAAVAIVIAILFYSQQRQKRLASATTAIQVGLPINSFAPPFELTAYAGGTTSLKQLLDYGKPLLLIFTNPNCGPCVVLFAEVKEWQQTHSQQLTIALLSFGTIKENFVNVARNGLGHVLLQKQREVAEKYLAKLTPTAVLISTDGRIASRLAAGADEIRALLTTVLENSNGDRGRRQEHAAG